MTRDEAFQQYEDSLASINKKAFKDTEIARAILRGQLSELREKAHEELKATLETNKEV